MRRPGIMIRGIAVILGAVALCAVAAISIPPPPTLLRNYAPVAAHLRLVAAAAHIAGLEGTSWVTDLELHNPERTPASGFLFLLKTGEDNGEAEGKYFTVQAGASLRLSDVVRSTFGESGATGAIVVGSDTELIVTSRTFNNDAAGTFGQYVEGYAAAGALTTGERATLIQLVQNAAFRTNLGIVNLGATAFDVDVDFYRSDGGKLGSRRYEVGPFMHVQDVKVLTRVTSGDVDDGYAVVTTHTPGARFFAYASVNDNRTGDPTQIVPATISSGIPLYLPGAARVGGYGGAAWRTDLEIHNPGTLQARFTVELLARDATNTAPEQRSFTLDGGLSVRYANVLWSVFGAAGAATLRITPTQGQLIAIQRTYNSQPTGTFGQFIAGMPEDVAVAYGQTARIVQLSQSSSDDSGFRTNLGLVNATGAPIAVAVALYRADGARLGTKSYELPAYGYQQEDKAFRTVTSEAVADGYAVLQTTTEAGRFFAYASVVDNRSGDPVTVPAQVVGPPPCSFTVGPTSCSHGAGDEEGTIHVTTDEDCSWYVESQSLWITAPLKWYTGSVNFAYYVAANPASSQRVGTLNVAGETVTVTQAGQACTYALTPTGRSHGAGAETGSFTVASPAGCTWTAAPGASWVHVTSGASGSGNGSVSYRLDANPDVAARTTTIVVPGPPDLGTPAATHLDVARETFTITQAGKACTYVLTPSSHSHGAGAETGSFTVTAPQGCTWAASPSASWVHVTGGASGSGNGSVSYRLDANPDAAVRTATIVVQGVSFTITQAGQVCTYVLTPTNRSHGPGAETGSFTVSAPQGCSWAANRTALWIEVTGGASGSGNGTVSYRLEANPDTTVRTATIVVHGVSFTITQTGQACTYGLTPTGRVHGAGAETGSFAVTAAAGCTWSATPTASWIQVTGGATGSGGGTVTYQIQANPADSPRVATISVHGVAFTITQAAAAEITVMLPGGVPMTLVRIRAGTFQMGSPVTERGREPFPRHPDETLHSVTLTQDYYIGKYEVTQRQWLAVTGSNPSAFTGCGLDCPVENVSWDDVCGGTTGDTCAPPSFIGKLNTYLGTTKFRLPTEAEWEYAARAGTATRFSHGDVLGCDDDCGACSVHAAYMWWCGDAGSTTHPVGRKGANPWGLYDVHGNVWEWVADWYAPYPSSPVTDPTGPATGPGRLGRGGDWGATAAWCRSAERDYGPSDTRLSVLGFRLARTP